MADVANLHKNFILYLTRHSPERLIEAVEFCTASRGLLTDKERKQAGLQPGKVRLISDLGMFELDLEVNRFRLVSIHPGIALDYVRAQTGGDFLFVKSFNEWVEGTAIEPGAGFGSGYLGLTCQYANEYRSR